VCKTVAAIGNSSRPFTGDELRRRPHPLRPPIVIRARQLPLEVRTRTGFDEFSYEWMKRYDEGTRLPTVKMAIERTFPVFNRSRWCGELDLYRFTDPAPMPAESLQIRTNFLRETLDLELRDKQP
jgi:hypothetical protein